MRATFFWRSLPGTCPESPALCAKSRGTMRNILPCREAPVCLSRINGMAESFNSTPIPTPSLAAALGISRGLSKHSTNKSDLSSFYAFSKSSGFMASCFSIPLIVPFLRSLLPQSGITVPLSMAGSSHLRWEPLPLRGISRQPRDRSFLVISL